MDKANRLNNVPDCDYDNCFYSDYINHNISEICSLNGTISLHYEKKTFKKGRDGKKELANIEVKDFPFKMASEKELMRMRISGKKLFILYKRGCRFYAEIPDISFGAFSNIAKTECIYESHCCDRLLPMPTEQGGCDKVYDLPLERYISKNYSFSELLQIAKRIDKYPFITEGYETCNIPAPVFVVLKCSKCTLN